MNCSKCGAEFPNDLVPYAKIWGGFTCPECHSINRVETRTMRDLILEHKGETK